MPTASGRGLCGGLRFTATLPSKWMAHCHCTLCQRAHGAERGFCTRCGSTLFFRSRRWPGELHIVRSNFDDPLDREPQEHVFYDTHAPWLVPGADGLRRKSAPGG